MTTTLRLALDATLISEAERLGIDVRQSLEADLRRRIGAARRNEAWREENKAAIDEANAELQRKGLWSDGF
jgi:post-segregation antitoxin (ccd killing protein)